MTISETIARLVHRGLSIDDAVETARLLSGDAMQSERRERVKAIPSNGETLESLGLTGDYAPSFPDTNDRPRKRRRRWSRVNYTLTAKAANHLRRGGTKVAAIQTAIDGLSESLTTTLRAVVKADRPVTARELEKLAGQKPKTVESSLYHLRHAGLVQSNTTD